MTGHRGDRRRERIFIKLTREIGLAVRLGGRQPETNPRLKLALIRARIAGMSPDAIELAIERAGRDELTVELESVRYEGYGPGGAAVLADCLTADRAATATTIRRAFSRFGGQLGASGAVGYLFNDVGTLAYPPASSGPHLVESAFDAGAEDVLRRADGAIEVLTDPADLEAVAERLERSGYRAAERSLTLRSATAVPVDGAAADSLARLLETLDELDDVQNVYTNAALPDSILARLPA